MINRRLNIKVALAGIAALLVISLCCLFVILRDNRDANEYIRDAQIALQAAEQAINDQEKKQYYEKAERDFNAAYNRTENDELRQDLLFMMADMYLETQEWQFVVGCWEEIININPKNIKAQYYRLRYLHILANSNAADIWQQVCEYSTDLLNVVQGADLLMEDISQWNLPQMEIKNSNYQFLGPYLYLLRGIGSLEMAGTGTVTNRDEVLQQAIEDFEKVLELEPANIEAYWHLARTAVARGDMLASAGDFVERDAAIRQAQTYLETAVNVADSNPKAHINLLNLKLLLAKSDGSESFGSRLQLLEKEYLSLIKKFDSSPEAFACLSDFYLRYSFYSGFDLSKINLDKAIEAIEKASSLDEQNVVYLIKSADLHYRMYSAFEQEEHIRNAIQIAKKALTLPDAQDIPGPRHIERMNNRFTLNIFLANCFCEQVIEANAFQSDNDKQLQIAEIEKAIKQIEQLIGSNEEPIVLKWHGMLELAEGNIKEAKRKLYTAYEQIKALKPSEPTWENDYEFAQLCYTLSQIYKDSSEVGAIHEFLVNSILSGIGETKPQAYLDYAEIALKYRRWSEALQNINAFEEYCGPSQRSNVLRVETYIEAGQYEDAEKELSQSIENKVDSIRLRIVLIQAQIRQKQLVLAQKQNQTDSSPQETLVTSESENYLLQELENFRNIENNLVVQLLDLDKNAVNQSLFVSVCNNYLNDEKINQGRDFANRYLSHFPDDITALIYREIFSESQPSTITQQRYKEIEELAIQNISDPVYRAQQLGIFYFNNNQSEKAIESLQDALQTGISNKDSADTKSLEKLQFTARNLFDIAIILENWELAEDVIQVIRNENLDDSEGLYYESCLLAAKGDYQEALAKIDECLKRKPVFSHAYIIRSNINEALGYKQASTEDIYKAASLNPLDLNIAKRIALILYERNLKLGSDATSTQLAEAQDALDRAIWLNPGDYELLGIYANSKAQTEPLTAIAIWQNLLNNAPSLENAVLIGKLATEVAIKEEDVQNKEALFAMAGSAFEQARSIEPDNKQMLYYYAEYYRAQGMENKALALLEESKDTQLLWSHHLRQGNYDEARKLLNQSYQDNPGDLNVLKGLMFVAEKTKDIEGLKRYSKELISIEDTIDNNLSQVQSYLSAGLIEEAEYRIQSIKEKFPEEPGTLLLQAWLLMKQGKLNNALELTNKFLQNSEKNAKAWSLRGEIYMQLHDYDKAIADFRTSKSLSDDPAIRVSTAKAYMNAQRYEDAITELRNAIEIPSIAEDALILLEYIYTQLNRTVALKNFYKETLEKYPNNAGWLIRGGAFALKTGDFDQAEQLYQKACKIRINLKPDAEPKEMIQDLTYATAFDGYMNALLKGAGSAGTNDLNYGKVEKVLQQCALYIDSKYAPIAYLRMAEAKNKLGEKITASEYFRASIEQTGTNEALAAEVLQRMYTLLGPEEVMKLCSQILIDKPDSLAGNFAMYNLAKINNDYIKAIDYIGKCINQIDKDNPLRIDYYILKAQMLDKVYKHTPDNKYIETAVSDYESLLTEMPNNIKVLNNLAYILADNNIRLKEALNYAKKAYDLQPEDPGIMDTLAFALYRNGKNYEAAEIMEAALHQYLEQNILVPWEVYEHKGMIKEALDLKIEALTAYRQAIDTGAEKLSPQKQKSLQEAIERVSN